MNADHDDWELVEGDGPLCAVAIHDGHELMPELLPACALRDEARLREEDPYTGIWTLVAPTRLVVRRSRFEVDLNRPRERAVYRSPKDSWGLQVWYGDLDEQIAARSLALYDRFYDQLAATLDRLVDRHGRVVVLDLHSYNHRRRGPGTGFDAQSLHPDVNVRTGTLDRRRWAPLVDGLIADLASCEDLGRRLDVRENVKFFGGNVSRWVHQRYPTQACCLSIEFKKFFMDEWTGNLYDDLHMGLLRLLRRCARGLVARLADLADDRPSIATPQGLWVCDACGAHWQTREVLQSEHWPPFRCAQCEAELTFVGESASERQVSGS